eukprot:CAMPEP_0201582460 /NCGR_PEP_ID=MMETSP0190_2-20130828/85530_1 /ASSEMBLY_ACC=CAM_ASM_000263 /TAXON_ID=37353 /ORGANISM="Rosalina sp." /LENGTH=31 /DNA_ID= /DNA_START= /DNA_END= /DNA_ORIENTATION=
MNEDLNMDDDDALFGIVQALEEDQKSNGAEW